MRHGRLTRGVFLQNGEVLILKPSMFENQADAETEIEDGNEGDIDIAEVEVEVPEAADVDDEETKLERDSRHVQEEEDWFNNDCDELF